MKSCKRCSWLNHLKKLDAKSDQWLCMSIENNSLSNIWIKWAAALAFYQHFPRKSIQNFTKCLLGLTSLFNFANFLGITFCLYQMSMSKSSFVKTMVQWISTNILFNLFVLLPCVIPNGFSNFSLIFLLALLQYSVQMLDIVEKDEYSTFSFCSFALLNSTR